jgi:hypothetical protein
VPAGVSSRATASSPTEPKRESRAVDFKDRFDPESEAECIELVKDIVAMSNSGGGTILIGIKDDGSPSGADVSNVMRLDAAQLTDKVFRYTGEHFDNFTIRAATRGQRPIAVLDVGAGEELLIFVKPGNYVASNGKQRSAFSTGNVYFRHGAKSEPCTPSDLRRHIQRLVAAERSRWMRGIRQVVESPRGSRVAMVQEAASDQEGHVSRVRLTDDPSATVFGRLNPDVTHPHRQSAVVELVNKKLGSRGAINQHDVLSVRSSYKIDESSRPDFAYKPTYDSLHYSVEFVDWLFTQFTRDADFFRKARSAYREATAKKRR